MAHEIEKKDPFAALDGRKASTVSGGGSVVVGSLKDADEALNFLETHPRSTEIAEEVCRPPTRIMFTALTCKSCRARQSSKTLHN